MVASRGGLVGGASELDLAQHLSSQAFYLPHVEALTSGSPGS